MFIKNLKSIKKFGAQLKKFEEKLGGPAVIGYQQVLEELYQLLLAHVYKTDMVDIAKDVRALAFMTAQAQQGDVLRKDLVASVKELIATIEAMKE